MSGIQRAGLYIMLVIVFSLFIGIASRYLDMPKVVTSIYGFASGAGIMLFVLPEGRRIK